MCLNHIKKKDHKSHFYGLFQADLKKLLETTTKF